MFVIYFIPYTSIIWSSLIINFFSLIIKFFKIINPATQHNYSVL